MADNPPLLNPFAIFGLDPDAAEEAAQIAKYRSNKRKGQLLVHPDKKDAWPKGPLPQNLSSVINGAGDAVDGLLASGGWQAFVNRYRQDQICYFWNPEEKRESPNVLHPPPGENIRNLHAGTQATLRLIHEHALRGSEFNFGREPARRSTPPRVAKRRPQERGHYSPPRASPYSSPRGGNSPLFGSSSGPNHSNPFGGPNYSYYSNSPPDFDYDNCDYSYFHRDNSSGSDKGHTDADPSPHGGAGGTAPRPKRAPRARQSRRAPPPPRRPRGSSPTTATTIVEDGKTYVRIGHLTRHPNNEAMWVWATVSSSYNRLSKRCIPARRGQKLDGTTITLLTPLRNLSPTELKDWVQRCQDKAEDTAGRQRRRQREHDDVGLSADEA